MEGMDLMLAIYYKLDNWTFQMWPGLRGLGMEGMDLLLALILIRQFDLPDVTRIKRTRYGGNGPVVGYIL